MGFILRNVGSSPVGSTAPPPPPSPSLSIYLTMAAAIRQSIPPPPLEIYRPIQPTHLPAHCRLSDRRQKKHSSQKYTCNWRCVLLLCPSAFKREEPNKCNLTCVFLSHLPAALTATTFLAGTRSGLGWLVAFLAQSRPSPGWTPPPPLQAAWKQGVNSNLQNKWFLFSDSLSQSWHTHTHVCVAIDIYT